MSTLNVACVMKQKYFVGKIVEFETETWKALHCLAQHRVATFWELADESF